MMTKRLLWGLICLLLAATPMWAQDEDAYQEALQEIEWARVGNGTRFSFQGRSLLTLPSEIGQLKNLEVIDLTGNKLTSLPPEIGQLDKLIYLILSQ